MVCEYSSQFGWPISVCLLLCRYSSSTIIFSPDLWLLVLIWTTEAAHLFCCIIFMDVAQQFFFFSAAISYIKSSSQTEMNINKIRCLFVKVSWDQKSSCKNLFAICITKSSSGFLLIRVINSIASEFALLFSSPSFFFLFWTSKMPLFFQVWLEE